MASSRSATFACPCAKQQPPSLKAIFPFDPRGAYGTLGSFREEYHANLFKAGHRICLDVTNLDVPTGVGGATNVEYFTYLICSSRTVLHKDPPRRAAPIAFAAAGHSGWREGVKHGTAVKRPSDLIWLPSAYPCQ
jgi:hypothetical protein